jgi:type II secretory pathway pseudopilin PulG
MRKVSVGFTIIEVLTVVVIAGMIMLIVAIGTGGVRSNARDDKRQADLAKISSVIEKFRSDCSRYPTLAEFTTAVSSGVLIGNGDTPSCASSSVYTNSFPKDPENPTRSYSYNVNASGSTYSLCSSLEEAPVPPMTVTSCTNSCGSACNYIIQNP